MLSLIDTVLSDVSTITFPPIHDHSVSLFFIESVVPLGATNTFVVPPIIIVSSGFNVTYIAPFVPHEPAENMVMFFVDELNKNLNPFTCEVFRFVAIRVLFFIG